MTYYDLKELIQVVKYKTIDTASACGKLRLSMHLGAYVKVYWVFRHCLCNSVRRALDIFLKFGNLVDVFTVLRMTPYLWVVNFNFFWFYIRSHRYYTINAHPFDVFVSKLIYEYSCHWWNQSSQLLRIEYFFTKSLLVATFKLVCWFSWIVHIIIWSLFYFCLDFLLTKFVIHLWDVIVFSENSEFLLNKSTWRIFSFTLPPYVVILARERHNSKYKCN